MRLESCYGMGTGDASSRGADKGLARVVSIGDNHTQEALAEPPSDEWN